jgi:hypothetical protein
MDPHLVFAVGDIIRPKSIPSLHFMVKEMSPTTIYLMSLSEGFADEMAPRYTAPRFYEKVA